MSVPLVNDDEIKVHFGPQANIQDCFNLPKKITGTAEYTGPSHIQRQDLTTGSRRFSPLCIRGPAIALIVTHKYHFPGGIVEKTKSEDMLKTHPFQEKDVRYSEQKTQH